MALIKGLRGCTYDFKICIAHDKFGSTKQDSESFTLIQAYLATCGIHTIRSLGITLAPLGCCGIAFLRILGAFIFLCCFQLLGDALVCEWKPQLNTRLMVVLNGVSVWGKSQWHGYSKFLNFEVLSFANELTFLLKRYKASEIAELQTIASIQTKRPRFSAGSWHAMMLNIPAFVLALLIWVVMGWSHDTGCSWNCRQVLSVNRCVDGGLHRLMPRVRLFQKPKNNVYFPCECLLYDFPVASYRVRNM